MGAARPTANLHFPHEKQRDCSDLPDLGKLIFSINRSGETNCQWNLENKHVP